MKVAGSIKQKIPGYVRHILTLFITSRIILTIIGLVSRALISPYFKRGFQGIYPKVPWIDIWGLWDSNWYLRVAQNWYPKILSLPGQSNYGFLPLYPLLIRMLGTFLHNDVIAALVISNGAFLISCLFLYRLVLCDDDKDTALRAVTYLIIFPTSFFLSAVFLESLSLALTIVCFYYARKEKWFYVGACGFFLSLTKIYGVLLVLPLLYEYFKVRDYNMREVRLSILNLLLIPLGLFLFMAYCYYQTHDGFAYVHAKVYGWGHALQNPLFTLSNAFLNGSVHAKIFFPLYYCLTLYFALILLVKKIRFSYFIYTILIFLFILSWSNSLIFGGMCRYLSGVFTFPLLFANISRDQTREQVFTILFAMLQGFLMVFWVNGFIILI